MRNRHFIITLLFALMVSSYQSLTYKPVSNSLDVSLDYNSYFNNIGSSKTFSSSNIISSSSQFETLSQPHMSSTADTAAPYIDEMYVWVKIIK